MVNQLDTPDRSSGKRKQRIPRGWPIVSIIAVAIIAFLAGGFGGSYQAKLSEVQKNDNASFLPHSAESTRAGDESAKFLSVESIPGFVVFHRDGGLTDDDKARIDKARAAVAEVPGVDKQSVVAAQYSTDKTTASLYAPLIAKQNGTAVNGQDLSVTEQKVIDVAKEAATAEGLAVHPAGPGGLLVAFIDAFNGLDGALLLAALAVVIVILLFVYRSPVLWIFPILADVLALGIASLVVYYLAKHDVITLNGQSQGIMSVLVLGAGTDYALLLTSRYREELHVYDNRFEAMVKAWKESAAAICASATTVVIGLLCLMFSQLNSNKGLGPVAAIGIGCTLLVMMTFLPVALSLCGRWVFWPRKPKVDEATDISTHGLWGRVSNAVVQHRRPAWIGATVILLLAVFGLSMLHTDGLTVEDSFTSHPDAVVGQRLYDAKFDKGTGAPAVIVANESKVDEVMKVAATVDGISTKPGAICKQVDLAKLAALAGQLGSAGLAGSQPQCPPAALEAKPIDGRMVVNATLVDSYDSPQAIETVKRLRTAMHGIEGADVLVGGSTASTLDVQKAAVHDRNLIIPIVLLVIFLVLALLLRSIVAPILLILSVVLSFAAALGVSAFAFEHIFGFAGADQSFPLFAFVFLVALGIDYNIFLMTRVREESTQFGTREGIRRGLSVTGGVITSAGVVLAATFAVLTVIPLVFLAEVGFTVAFGVLLDTILVRSILVPALSHDIGRKIWWPSKLAAAGD